MNLTTNKEIFFFKKIPFFLIIFLPLTLITGPFLSDLSISIVSIIFIIFIIKYRYYNLLNNLFSKVFLFFGYIFYLIVC